MAGPVGGSEREMGEKSGGGSRSRSGRGGRRRRSSGLTPDDDENSSVSPRAGVRTGASSTALGTGLSAPEENEAVKERDVTETRSFPHYVKQQCWDKAERIKGRDPDRWRRDPLGNIVFRKLVGCPGCLCHDYDHIIPYSKGGKSTLENCQVLQATVNRSKGNKTEISKAELIQKSAYCRVSGRDMDLLELSAYGNVRRGQETGGCSIQ